MRSPLHTPFCPRVADSPSLIFLHEDIHETFGRIEYVLESAAGIRGFVGVSSDRITLVQCHEWQDFVLKIFPRCPMAD